jgi:uncharacterized protein YigE (DUF2233 family)
MIPLDAEAQRRKDAKSIRDPGASASWCLGARILPLVALVLVSLACGATATPVTPVPIPTTRIDPSPTPEPDDTGWKALSSGVELRRLSVTDANGITNRLWLARLDPTRVRFRVVYDPANPRLVSEWFDAAKALLVVNAGYFTEDHHATGLVISDGVRSGKSYVGFGGMFAVRTNRVEVRWLVAKPYNSAEPLRQAVQAFPMLVHSGGKPGVTEDDGDLARRTVVGQDRRGRIVFLVSPDSFFTLKNLSAFLAASDLQLDTALNLDGGTSSGLMLAGPDGSTGVDSWVKIPAVIVAEAR